MPPIRPAAQQLVGPVLTPTLVDTGTESVAGLATLTGGSQAGSGSAAAPAYSFSAAANYGWFYDGVNGTLAASANGVEGVQLGKDSATGKPQFSFGVAPIAGETISIRSLGSGNTTTLMQLYDAIGTGQMIFSDIGRMCVRNNIRVAAAGNAIAPCFQVATGYGGSSGTGMWGNDGAVANSLAFSANGVQVAGINGANGQWSGIKGATASKTANYTVLATESFTTFDNTGAGAQVTFTLPTATAGLEYLFVNTGSGATFAKVLAVGTDKIAQNGVLGAAAGNLVSTAIWTVINIQCVTAGTWVVIQGAWTLT